MENLGVDVSLLFTIVRRGRQAGVAGGGRSPKARIRISRHRYASGDCLEPGQTVRWVVERHAHTATAYDPANDGSPRRIPLGAVPWDSGYLLDPGDAFETTLTVEGGYDYYCKPHKAAGMVGRIVVSDAAERSFEAPEWSPGPSDRAVPEAASRAFPSVERILRERVVREGWTLGFRSTPRPEGAAPLDSGVRTPRHPARKRTA